MTDLEQQARTRLDAHTADVPAGPDLHQVLRAGRRRRRQRRLAVAAGGVAAVTVLGTAAVVGLTGDDGPARRAVDAGAGAPSAPAPAPAPATDFVPGSAVDERLAALVAEHYPDLPPPDDVYPSDEHTAGALPDGAHARATEWQAVYTPGPGHQVLVLMGFPVTDEDPAATCDGVPGPQCTVAPRPDGGLDVFQRYSSGEGVTFFYSQVDADGFRVSLLDTAASPERSLEDVRRARDLVADPRFTFSRGS